MHLTIFLYMKVKCQCFKTYIYLVVCYVVVFNTDLVQRQISIAASSFILH